MEADNERRKRKKTEKGKRKRSDRKAVALKGQKRIYVTMTGVFLLVMVIFCALNLLHKDQAFSEKENRVLSQRPQVTFGNISNGRFMEQYESYRADQMTGRNLWVQVKTFADSVGGKKEENGIFNGKDSYLLEDIAVPDEENLKENLEAMQNFRSAYGEVPMHVILVPNAANILKNKLPMLAVTADQSKLIEGVHAKLGAEFDWIDAQKALKAQKDLAIYYRTDHHWTTLGAYEVFKAAKEQLGLAEKEEIPMKAYGVSNTFNGTLSAVSGYQTGYKEAIYIYLPEGENVPQIVVNYVEEQKKTASLYDSEKLGERDQYAVFLGGNHAVVDIKSTLEGGERLLVIKDSYANCFIPFLAPYYREIVVVDPRYYTGDLDQIMVEKKIDRVLFLYSGNTFFEDRVLSGVLNTAGDIMENMENDSESGEGNSAESGEENSSESGGEDAGNQEESKE
ncbi:DHHW family protein [Roseburia hominis]